MAPSSPKSIKGVVSGYVGRITKRFTKSTHPQATSSSHIDVPETSQAATMSKPVFYTFGHSVWAAAAELAIAELGYADDAIETKVVNLVEGANFTPDFLKINPNGTLPTLVADGKAFTNTKDVVHYLVEHAPKKVASGTAFVDTIHEDRLDPNLPIFLARNEEELKANASGFSFVFADNRQKALEKYSELPEAASFKGFHDAKKAGNGGVLAILKGEVPDAVKDGFFTQSVQHWETLAAYITNELPAALPETGPFLGGAAPGEDDFHLGAWLARLVFLTQGTADKDGYKSLEKETKGPVSPKVAAYWAAWVERASFKKVYANGLH